MEVYAPDVLSDVTPGAYTNPIDKLTKQHTMRGFIFPYQVSLLGIERVNQDIFRLQLEKPDGYTFRPGQAIDVSIAEPGHELDVAPFTLFNRPADPYLELIVKIRPNPGSLTGSLSRLWPGATLQIIAPWEVYRYIGPGVFLAAGTGITAFLPLLRELAAQGKQLYPDHHLVYAISEPSDMLYEEELASLLSHGFTCVVSRSPVPTGKGWYTGHISENLLRQVVHKDASNYYVCGPRSFEKSIHGLLLGMGVDAAHVQTGYPIYKEAL